MALHNLKITVIDGGKGGAFGGDESSDENAEKKDSPRNSKLYKFLNYNQTIWSKIKKTVSSPATFFAIQQGVGLATQTGKQFINYYVSDIGRRHGDSNYQAIVGRRIEQVTDYTSLATGALSGAAAGSIGGIPGAFIGAIIGAVSSGVNMGFKYAERERAYQHEAFKENNSQAYQLARANYTILTGRAR